MKETGKVASTIVIDIQAHSEWLHYAIADVIIRKMFIIS